MFSGSADELALTAEPTDQVVSKNASAVIDCGAPAAWVQHQPPPLMEWKRDGVLLNFIGDARRWTRHSFFSLFLTSVSINPAGRPSVRLISGRVALSARRISDSRKKQLDQLWTSWLNRHKFGWTCLARGSRDSINKMTFAFQFVPVNFWNFNSNFIKFFLNFFKLFYFYFNFFLII